MGKGAEQNGSEKDSCWSAWYLWGLWLLCRGRVRNPAGIPAVPIWLRENAELDRLIEIAKIQSTEASNEIEGIWTTNTRLKQFVTDKTTPHNRDEEEIMGYRDVLNTIHENFEYIPIRSNYILQLHRDLYQYSHKSICGTFKNTQNYISAVDSEGREFVLFTPLAPYETPPAIEEICESYNRIIDTQEVEKQSKKSNVFWKNEHKKSRYKVKEKVLFYVEIQ